MQNLKFLFVNVFLFTSIIINAQSSEDDLYNVMKYNPYSICLKLLPNNFKEKLPDNEFLRLKSDLINDSKVKDFEFFGENNAFQFIYDNSCQITLTFEKNKLSVIQYNFNYDYVANNFFNSLKSIKNMRYYKDNIYNNEFGEKSTSYKISTESYNVEFYF